MCTAKIYSSSTIKHELKANNCKLLNYSESFKSANKLKIIFSYRR